MNFIYYFRFANDIEYMTGKRPFLFWMICWKYISPLAILIIFIANCHKLATKSPSYKAYVGCTQQKVSIGASYSICLLPQIIIFSVHYLPTI